MEFKRYLTYNEAFKIDISIKESLYKIKYIFGRYRKEVILSFLGFVAKEINFGDSIDIYIKVQKYFEIKKNGILIHNRVVLALFQIYFETRYFSQNNTKNSLENYEIELLFLCGNQILSKSEFKLSHVKEGITVEHLMALMKIHIGSISAYDSNIMNETFAEFYKELLRSDKYDMFNEVIFKRTSLTIEQFIDLIENFDKNDIPENIFEIYDKFAVLDYRKMNNIWDERIPKINIPFDYRFFEQFPLIKREEKYHPTSILMLFISLIRKVYHILSQDENTKMEFRSFWGKYIVEVVIKRYLKRIFNSTEVNFIDLNFQQEIGVEFSDLMMVHHDDIYLFEIKSGYMSLESRYTQNANLFKVEFEKKYIFNSTGKHQLINQLDIFDKVFKKISGKCNLYENVKYRVFSCSIVFDEALMMLGFKRYLGKAFNDILSIKIESYKNFIPYLYSNLLTFNELIGFERRVPDIAKRIKLLKTTFGYQDSLDDLFFTIKNGTTKVSGISQDDIT